MYVDKGMSMREISLSLNISMDAVVYCIRKNNIPRRSPQESNALVFKNKKLSFHEVSTLSHYQQKLKIAGSMLYWAEGYKSGLGNTTVDFANSDPEMITVFTLFLRKIYRVDEKRLRVLLYCYSDQSVSELVRFWSKLTKIPENQFTKPYVREDFRKDGRKMKYGMIHVRYADKKLFLSILDSIEKMKKNMRRW